MTITPTRADETADELNRLRAENARLIGTLERNGIDWHEPNEWQTGISEKPRITCAECTHRQFLPITDRVIHEHLTGKITPGICIRGCREEDESDCSDYFVERFCTVPGSK